MRPPSGLRESRATGQARPARTYARLALPLLVGAVLALGVVHYAGPAGGRVGPFRVEMGARLAARGQTTVAVPPFGEISAPTHQRVPLEVRLTLVGVDLPELETWVGQSSSAGEALTSAEGSLGPLVQTVVARAVALAAVLGGLGALAVTGERRGAAAGALTSVLTVGLLAAGVGFEFDRAAFTRPHYQGALEAAPWAVGLLEKNWGRVGNLGDQLESLAENLSGLSDQLGGLAVVARPPSDLRLLHVSDLHNNPVGAKFIAEAVEAFAVDAVVDTGDLTDWGTPLEETLVRDITRLGVPYFFVPGNHDSPDLLRRLGSYPQVRILGDRPSNFRGLVLLGIADPSAVKNDPEPAKAEELAALGKALGERVNALEARPDVVAVHNGLVAREVAGLVGVVLHGHDHRLSVKTLKGSTVIDAGTTGAAGVRGLLAHREVPYSMALLHFSGTAEGYRLRAVDTLEVRGREAGFALNRILVDNGGDSAPPGEPTTDGPGARPAQTGR